MKIGVLNGDDIGHEVVPEAVHGAYRRFRNVRETVAIEGEGEVLRSALTARGLWVRAS